VGDEVLLTVKFLWRLVSVREVNTAGNVRFFVLLWVLRLFIIIGLRNVLDSKELDDACCLGFILGLFLLNFACEDCLGLWLGKNCFLSCGLNFFVDGIDLFGIKLEDLLSLSWRCIEFDFEDGVRDSVLDVHVIEMLGEVKEQVDMVAICEEGSLLPDFCCVFIQLVLFILSSDLLKSLSLLFL